MSSREIYEDIHILSSILKTNDKYDILYLEFNQLFDKSGKEIPYGSHRFIIILGSVLQPFTGTVQDP